MTDKKLQERDFQVYRGWKIPFFIRFAWAVFFIAGIWYLAVNMVPDLTEWLNK